MKNKELALYKKMSQEELQGFLYMHRRNFIKKNKTGKGSYNRKEGIADDLLYK